jgi:hypothetical protein
VLISLTFVAVGSTLLRYVRSVDSLAYILIAGIVSTGFYLIGAVFTALTGYTFSKYNPHQVPRVTSINYVVIAGVTCLIAISAARCRQRQLSDREAP